MFLSSKKKTNVSMPQRVLIDKHIIQGAFVKLNIGSCVLHVDNNKK